MTEPNHQPRKVGGEPLATIEHQYMMVTKNGSTVPMSRDDIVAMKSCSVLIRNSAAIESQIFDLKQQQSMLKENAS